MDLASVISLIKMKTSSLGSIFSLLYEDNGEKIIF